MFLHSQIRMLACVAYSRESVRSLEPRVIYDRLVRPGGACLPGSSSRSCDEMASSESGLANMSTYRKHRSHIDLVLRS